MFRLNRVQLVAALSVVGTAAITSPLLADGGSSSNDGVYSIKPQLTQLPNEILPFDFTGDGSVTATDLAILLAQWGSDGPGDIDFDGNVGAADLAIFMANWYIAPQVSDDGEPIPSVACMTGDLNGDGFTEAFDLAILLVSWGRNSRYDLTGDNIVGPADLAMLLASWSDDAHVPDPEGTGAQLFDADHDGKFTVNDIIETTAQIGSSGSADFTKNGTVDQLDVVSILDAWYTIDFQPYIEPQVPVSPGDLSGDGVVGPIDLVLLLLDYGMGGKSAADLDGNGSVGPEDLALMLAEWE